jgi:hypothetical protein
MAYLLSNPSHLPYRGYRVPAGAAFCRPQHLLPVMPVHLCRARAHFCSAHSLASLGCCRLRSFLLLPRLDMPLHLVCEDGHLQNRARKRRRTVCVKRTQALYSPPWSLSPMFMVFMKLELPGVLTRTSWCPHRQRCNHSMPKAIC